MMQHAKPTLDHQSKKTKKNKNQKTTPEVVNNILTLYYLSTEVTWNF